jgi:hypothetical protein
LRTCEDTVYLILGLWHSFYVKLGILLRTYGNIVLRTEKLALIEDLEVGQICQTGRNGVFKGSGEWQY